MAAWRYVTCKLARSGRIRRLEASAVLPNIEDRVVVFEIYNPERRISTHVCQRIVHESGIVTANIDRLLDYIPDSDDTLRIVGTTQIEMAKIYLVWPMIGLNGISRILWMLRPSNWEWSNEAGRYWTPALQFQTLKK